MRPGSRTKVSVPLVLPQNRHPDRSASQIDHVTQCLWRVVEEPVLSGVEGTSAMLIVPTLFGAYQPPNPPHWLEDQLTRQLKNTSSAKGARHLLDARDRTETVGKGEA